MRTLTRTLKLSFTLGVSGEGFDVRDQSGNYLAVIKVVGTGGGGSNAVSSLILRGSALAGGAVFGAIIAIRSLFSGPMSIGAIPWRAVILILGAPLVFGLTLRGIGLVPAVFVMVLIASLADPEFDLRFSLLVSAGLALFCWLVFGLGLGLTVPPIGPWLGMR